MRVFLALVLWAALAPANAAVPAGISLNPVSITLDAQRPADAVTLLNGTAETKVIQVQVMRWSREHGKDSYTPVADMIASPPMFRVAAGAKQVVRIGLKTRASAAGPAEKTYRMFLQEVPETAPVTTAENGGTSLRLLLRFGIPVFVKPAVVQPVSMDWKARRLRDGSIALSVSNMGNRHLKLADVRLESAGASANASGFAYVFAGETYTWTLKPTAALKAGEASVSASTDDGPVHAGLALLDP